MGEPAPRTAAQEPVEPEFRFGGETVLGKHWRWCPRCSHELHNERCRLRCPRCHCFMSCSDFD